MKSIIVANWKMNPARPEDAQRLFDSLGRRASRIRGVEVIVAPPFVYLPLLAQRLASSSASHSGLALGAQDVFFKDEGPFTGEISAKMLKQLRVSHVIVGHSERREHLGETDEMINKKVKAALGRGLKPILCVGEKEREGEGFPAVVREELQLGLKGIPRTYASRTIIAYEPIWALSYKSRGRADTPQDIFEMAIYIRRIILDIWGKAAAYRIPILYGGSVNAKNARNFLEVKGIQGFLVGQASLRSSEFNAILDAAAKK